MGLILITHDLGVVADVAERISVMYAGRTMERGIGRRDLHQHGQPVHVRAAAVDPQDRPARRRGCRPSRACRRACSACRRAARSTPAARWPQDKCRVGEPPAAGEVAPDHGSRCWFAEEVLDAWPSPEPIRVIEAKDLVQHYPITQGHPVQEADRRRPGRRRRQPVPRPGRDAGDRGGERLRQVHHRPAADGSGAAHVRDRSRSTARTSPA